MTHVENIAHRGASLHAPENTLAAFELALARGADRIELDVQLSRDGEVVVTHDATMTRTTDAATRFPGREPWDVRDLTWAELSQLTVNGQAGEGRPTPRVAGLGHVLDVLAGRTTLLLELKSPGRHPGLADAVAEVLLTRDWWLDARAPERLVVQSFDREAMDQFRRLLPSSLRCAWLVAEDTTPDLHATPDWASVVVVDHRVVTRALVDDVHTMGRPLWTYTVNEPSRVRTMVDVGVDGIITDDPGAVSALSDDRVADA